MCGRFWQGEFGELLKERFKVDAMQSDYQAWLLDDFLLAL
jgi:hypothetical protein